MKSFLGLRLSLTVMAALLAAGSLRMVRAQVPDQDDQSRGVARISFMEGEVSVRRGDGADWVAGVVNAPLLSNDWVSTAPNSRAEIQFDAANLMRIGGNAAVNLATLEYGRYQVELAHGTVSYVVLRPSSANVEVDTPSVSVRPSKQGVYRIVVTPALETQVIVRAGEVEVFTPHGSQWVSAGQMMQARGAANDPEFQIVNAGPPDEWDRWNQNRDQLMLRSASYQYVPQGVYGAEDLDQYGTWNNVPPYGEVWTPSAVPAGWAPYGNGRWVWEDWYGWTWVSYDPWGWAPYHYGRWFWSPGFGWCWYPGVIGVRHYWSPALVAFFGYGPGVGVGFGFGFGNIGWVPLAPYEVFHPWWGRGFYGRGFGVVNITNINVVNTYRNARFGGISAMNVNDFHAGRFGAIARVPGDRIGTAGLVRGQVPIAPAASHLQFSNRAAAYAPRNGVTNTHFFTHQQSAAAPRMPFAQQQRGFEQASRGLAPPSRGAGFGGQQPAGMSRGPQAGNWRPSPGTGAAPALAPRGGAIENAPRGGAIENAPRGGGMENAPRGGAMENVRPPAANPGGSTGGWQRFGTPRGASDPAGSGSGWGRFGEPRSFPQSQAAPRSNYPGGYGSYGGYGAQRYGGAPPVVRERQSAPSYSAPGYSAPRGGYSAPRSAPSYSAPRSAPSYSAPRGGGGGPRGGGGGGHSSGGGHHR